MTRSRVSLTTRPSPIQRLLPTLRLLAGGAHPALVSCCLAVFAQTGLADVLSRDDALELRLNFSAAKADLESAPLLRRLRQR